MLNRIEELLKKHFNKKFDNNTEIVKTDNGRYGWQTRTLSNIYGGPLDTDFFKNVCPIAPTDHLLNMGEEEEYKLSFNPIFSQGPIYSSVAGKHVDPNTGEEWFGEEETVLDENGWRK